MFICNIYIMEEYVDVEGLSEDDAIKNAKKLAYSDNPEFLDIMVFEISE